MVNQGDIIKVSFNLQKGHEQAGYRPAVVVSNIFFSITKNICQDNSKYTYKTVYPFTQLRKSGKPLLNIKISRHSKSAYFYISSGLPYLQTNSAYGELYVLYCV